MASEKASLTDLALFGGIPAFPDKLHIGRPNLGSRERFIKKVEGIFEHRMLSNGGPLLSELEKQIADRIGVRHCIAVCNATLGLEIAVRALDVSGEVIVPAFTFVATAHCLQWQQITPKFCDVASKTHVLDPDAVEAQITSKTKAILGVHLWGRGCYPERLHEIARRHGLKLIFDAAHAFGCEYRGEKIGGFGDAEVFSFHATKFFNTAEGGAIVTNNDDLAKKIRLMTNFGFAGYDNVVSIGTNGKMSELSAALGLTNLENLDDFIRVNLRNYRRYSALLSTIPGIRLLPYDDKDRNNYQYIVLEIDPAIAGLSRDKILEILWAENILVRRYFYPACHRMEPYRTLYPGVGRHLPVTEKLAERVLTLPTGTSISEKDIDTICGIIRFAITHAEAIHANVSGEPRNKAA